MMRLCAVVLLVLGLAGCRGDKPPPQPAFANWPAALNDFRFRWAAEPGIDLVSGPTVPLRAYLESYRVAQLASDTRAVYPGFERAVPLALPPKSNTSTRGELVDIRPSPDAEPFGPTGPFYGNDFFHVLELTPIAGGYRAYVCDGMYGIFREGEEPDKFVSVINYDSRTGINDYNGVKVWRVEFTDTPPAPEARTVVTAEQRGPNPAPLDDVFGPWRITGASDDTWGTLITNESIPFSESGGMTRIAQCSAKVPDAPDGREAFIDSVLDTPPPAEPASPGWPDNAA